jgi:zinc/manganese transport system substrate-binding protein
MRRLSAALALILVLAAPAQARVRVVATLPWIGSLAAELGGDLVEVATLVKPMQDPHSLEAKPSMILAARKADIIMFNGLDLEIGYLPLILESAKNPKILPGQPGNLDCSRFVTVIERQMADRSQGDVHPLGNPHYHFSPANVLRVAEGMSLALAALDASHADGYRAGYARFADRLQAARERWNAAAPRGRRIVAYHRMFEYLAADFGLLIVGYVEPKPGIPPAAAHLDRLVADMRREPPAGILATAYQGRKEAEALSARTGVKAIVMPHDVGALPGTDDWFGFMDRVIALLP